MSRPVTLPSTGAGQLAHVARSLDLTWPTYSRLYLHETNRELQVSLAKMRLLRGEVTADWPLAYSSSSSSRLDDDDDVDVFSIIPIIVRPAGRHTPGHWTLANE